MIVTEVCQLIGHTPLLQVGPNLLAKLEFCNPTGSVKDRATLAMIRDAERRGLLTPASTIIEPTSGNTGIGLCAIAAQRGYRCVIVMPENMSRERQMLMTAYGATVLLSPAQEGMTGAIRMARELAEKTENAFIPGQFDNPANPQAHFDTTGPEIWQDTQGKVDIFVAGVGTGGTVTGVGQYLKAQNPHIQVIAVEPAGSPVLSGGKAGPHGLQGIGAGFVPSILDRSVIDRVVPVTEEEAYTAARQAGRELGILVGISSGAALHVARQVATQPKNQEKTIVVLLPDSGQRYLSTDLFA